jgi:hypothetical protein
MDVLVDAPFSAAFCMARRLAPPCACHRCAVDWTTRSRSDALKPPAIPVNDHKTRTSQCSIDCGGGRESNPPDGDHPSQPL